MSCAVFKLFHLFIFAYFLPYEREPEVHKYIHPKHFQVSGIKISNAVTKETSQILLQTLWHLRKPQKKNLVSLRGDSSTDVGYNFGQFETLLGCIDRYHCEF